MAALPLADRIVAQYPQYGLALFNKERLQSVLSNAAASELEEDEAVRYATQAVQTALTLVSIEPDNTLYLNTLGIRYVILGEHMWEAGQLRAAIAFSRKGVDTLVKATSGGVVPVTNLADAAEFMVSMQAQLGDAAGASATLAAAAAATSRLPLAGSTMLDVETLEAAGATVLADERDDFTAALRIEQNAVKRLPNLPAGTMQAAFMSRSLCSLADPGAQAEYATGRFTAAEQSERTALQACKVGEGFGGERNVDQVTIWLSMSLARGGKQAEAAQTISPVVTMYRGLEKKNHGDAWLPLEFAEALYAQSLSEPTQRAALLRQASALVDHLIPTIARLHDTQEWRARIEAAQHPAGG